ncbi:hypothetical protein CSW76_26760, partial [Shigella flexneri]
VSLPDGTPAIVKGLKPIEDIADELRGADYLVWRTPKRTGQRQMKQSAPSLSYSMYWGSKPPTANALPSICDWTL